MSLGIENGRVFLFFPHYLLTAERRLFFCSFGAIWNIIKRNFQSMKGTLKEFGKTIFKAYSLQFTR
jgi:hypothetical protein